MTSVSRWAIGLCLAPVLGYALLALYLVLRVRPLPVAVPWQIARDQQEVGAVVSVGNGAASRRRSKSLVKVAA